MGLFKKPNRKFRQREARDDSEDESNDADPPENPREPRSEAKAKSSLSNIDDSSQPGFASASASGVSIKEKDETSKPTKLLSFHDDEDDGEVFKLKKSSFSRRLAKQRERERKKKEDSASLALSETRGSVESSSSKTKGKDSWKIVSGDDVEDMDAESDEDKEKVNQFKDVLQSGVIPDAATIYAMKKHRAMAREMGDYVPIEDAEKDEEGKSRLIREDDNDRSDDDDDEPSRMSFTVNTGAAERQKIRETFLSLQEGSTNDLENEDAAELDRWEQEQIRKGVGVVQVGPQNPSLMEENLYYPAVVGASPFIANLQERSNIHSAPPLLEELLKKSEAVLTTNDIKARLEERLSMLKKQHEVHKQDLADCERMLIENQELVLKMQREGPERAQNFALYQQMSGYVRDLVECLDLKVAHIDLLDGRVVDLYKTHAQKLAYRRQLDIRDQSDEYSSLSSEILKGVSAEFLNEKNVCTDEARLRRSAEREGRRIRRRKFREKSILLVKHQDGMSTDDEEADSEMNKFNESKALIIDEANTVFEDVVEEFGSLDGLMKAFEKWKFARPDTYNEAFVPLCLPKIFGTFVKLSLLRWNPLQDEIVFEDKNWFRQILHYGVAHEDMIQDSDDPDVNLLPLIIEKIVIPKISGFIQNVWDPLSFKETSRLVKLFKYFFEYYPSMNAKSKPLQTCFKNVSNRVLKCLDDDIFIPLYPKELLENRSLGAADFFQRQLWTSVKLLQNILLWDGLIAEQPLQQLSLHSLLNRYILMGLHTSMTMRDTFDKCKMIVVSFPKSWFMNAKGTTTLPPLKQFSAFLVKYADEFHSQCSKKGIPEEDTKIIIKEIVQLLATIESLEDAVIVAKRHSVSAFKN